MTSSTIFDALKGELIVSCQALPNEALHSAEIMACMAVAAVEGGAGGIRANTPQDIRAIRRKVTLPIIGLFKDGDEDIYITPTPQHAIDIIEAGCDIVAMDATQRRCNLVETIAVCTERGIPVMADVSTLKEGLAAVEAGASCVGTTLSGYTPHSPIQDAPDLVLVEKLAKHLSVPVIAEGRIHTPEQAAAALATGAFAVVVGGAITRPAQITQRFAKAIKGSVGSA